jgi:hypothetical protein
MDVFKTAVRARYALEDVGQAIAEYVRQMSGGKLLLTP